MPPLQYQVTLTAVVFASGDSVAAGNIVDAVAKQTGVTSGTVIRILRITGGVKSSSLVANGWLCGYLERDPSHVADVWTGGDLTIEGMAFVGKRKRSTGL